MMRVITILCSALLLLESCSMSQQVNTEEINSYGENHALDVYSMSGLHYNVRSFHIDTDSARGTELPTMIPFRTQKASLDRVIHINHFVGSLHGAGNGFLIGLGALAAGWGIGFLLGELPARRDLSEYIFFVFAPPLGSIIGLIVGGVQGYKTEYIIHPEKQ